MKALRLFLLLALVGCTNIPVRRTYSLEYERDGQRVASSVTLEPSRSFKK